MFTAEPDLEFALESGLTNERVVKVAARPDAAEASRLFG